MISSRTVSYSEGATSLEGFFAWDAASEHSRPGVLVVPEAPGLDELARSRCRQLAQYGYAAFALDIHGDGQVLTNPADIKMRVESFKANAEGMSRRAAAALEALRSQPQVLASSIAVIGYCFGGTMALELARSGAALVALVGFHCELTTSREPTDARLQPRILVCLGSADPLVGAEQRAGFVREMDAAGADWQMHLYGGAMHAFTRPGVEALGRPGFAYSQRAADHAWNAMRALFAETLDR